MFSKGLWSGIFVWSGSTENSLGLCSGRSQEVLWATPPILQRQELPGSFGLFTGFTTNRVLMLGLAIRGNAYDAQGWKLGGAFKYTGNFKQFLCRWNKIQILYDKHTCSMCEFVNLIQIRTLGIRV